MVSGVRIVSDSPAERHARLPDIRAWQPAHGFSHCWLNARLPLTIDAFIHLVEWLEGQPMGCSPQVNAPPISTALQPLHIVHPVPDRQNATGCGLWPSDLAQALDEDLVVLLPGAIGHQFGH